MTRKIVWSKEAADDFDSAISCVAIDSKRRAALMANRIEAAIVELAHLPAGRQGRVTGTYEKPAGKTPYAIAYGLSDSTVRILRIIHDARDWLESDWPTE